MATYDLDEDGNRKDIEMEELKRGCSLLLPNELGRPTNKKPQQRSPTIEAFCRKPKVSHAIETTSTVMGKA